MPKKDRYWLHILLFVLSLATTTLAGAELINGWSFWGFLSGAPFLSWAKFSKGFIYSSAFLSFLTVHEFGHYFMARYHQVKASLPYYIPIFFPAMMNIGSFGAVIRIRQIPETTRKFFDIGITGPLAGFVVSVLLLVWGFTHLPNAEEYIFNVHPEYEEDFGHIPNEDEVLIYTLELNQAQLRIEGKEAEARSAEGITMVVGTNLLFEFLKWLFVEDPDQFPPAFEVMHYPFLFVGFMTLFFTALNLLPIGQLDGGHVTYGLFGLKRSGIISRVAVGVLMIIGGTGFLELGGEGIQYRIGLYLMFLLFVMNRLMKGMKIPILLGAVAGIFFTQLALKYFIPEIEPSLLWLLYSFLAVRFIGVDHPPAMLEQALDTKRKVWAWVAVIIFILCFSPNPISIISISASEAANTGLQTFLNY